MDDKRKRKLNIICTAVIIALAIISFVYALKFDYRLTEEDGKHYFVFNDISKYGMVSLGENWNYVMRAPNLVYPTAKELVRAVKFGNLTKEDKEDIALFPRDKNNRIEICDFDNFYQAIPANGWNVSGVEWIAYHYDYDFHKGDDEGSMRLFPSEEEYQFSYRINIEEYFESEYMHITKKEYDEDSQKEIIYYTYDTGRNKSEYKLVRYTLSDGDKNFYVQKKYRLPLEELTEIKVYATEGKAYYSLGFSNGSSSISEISDDELLQFGVERVYAISPWIKVTAFLGVGTTIGFFVYKKAKKRKEAQIV